ncbi:MAG: transposase family protein [Firmicutes bacterium]|nr:transposase family protein [Bacillota bacterium]
MSPKDSISETSKLRNFLLSLSFAFYFSKPALHHIEEFIIGAVQFGYRGKVIDLVSLSHAVCHRTTYGKFLIQGAWNEAYVWRAALFICLKQ